MKEIVIYLFFTFSFTTKNTYMCICIRIQSGALVTTPQIRNYFSSFFNIYMYLRLSYIDRLTFNYFYTYSF